MNKKCDSETFSESKSQQSSVRPLRIAINGYGRIGRNIVRAFYEHSPNHWPHPMKIVAINDPGDPEILAHLTRYDSVHGRFASTVNISGDSMLIDSDSIHVSRTRDPMQLPWNDLDVDIVFECTGRMLSREAAHAHIEVGADKVLISAPAKGAVDATVVFGVNHEILSSQHQIISNSSCTTNCLAPLLLPLHRGIGVVSGSIVTVHAYTNDQKLMDAHHSDSRRARSATSSIIPTKTGAAASIGLILPELSGKLDGFSVRVPVDNVSVLHLTFISARPTSVEEVNSVMSRAAQGSLQKVLYYSTEPLVSIDFNHNAFSSCFDAGLTKVVDKTLVTVSAWYDNEWAFAHRMLDVASFLGGGQCV